MNTFLTISIAFRYSVFYDEKCSCENILKENENERDLCFRKCQNGQEFFICGGNDTESIYETGSILPGPVKNLKIQEITEDSVTLAYDPPQRNGSELTSYSIKSFATKTFSSSSWTTSNQTLTAMKSSQHTFYVSNLMSATQYLITVTSLGGDLLGGEESIKGILFLDFENKIKNSYFITFAVQTRLKQPEPRPEPAKILKISEATAEIEVTRHRNKNGPVSKYLIVVIYENNFVKNDFDESLLSNYQKAKEDGLNYWITAEISPFQEETKLFTIGDGQKYGSYFNAPLPKNQGRLQVLVFCLLFSDFFN